MARLELVRQWKNLYAPSAKAISVVTAPPLNFLMVDGKGDPNVAPEYGDAVQALYALAYGLKFHIKKEQGIDYAVMPLEGLWWVDDMTRFNVRDKSAWQWTMMIVQPDFVSDALVQQVRQDVARKKALALSKIRFETFDEGLAAQIMYLGAYADEGPTIRSLHEHIRMTGHSLRGKHHEIYLGDPRKTAPAKLKTVIRQPIA